MGICCPHPFQVEAIQHSAFNVVSVTVVISKTGSGKTAIPLGAGLLRRGVTIIVVPLIGLGTHMVDNASDFDHGIEAYHLDEHCDFAQFFHAKIMFVGCSHELGCVSVCLPLVFIQQI